MDMKPVIHKSAAVIFFFLCLFVYTKLAGPIPFVVNSTNKADGFQVAGEGKALITPDKGHLTLGVQVVGATAQSVKDQMNVMINKVTEAVFALGISDKDVKTDNYSINPTYDYSAGSSPKITGYSSSTNLAVTVLDIAKVNSIIDAATKAGANQIGGVRFDNKDTTEAETEARQKAVTAAKAKAEQAAKAVGFKLGKVINYTENNTGMPGYRSMLIDKAASPDSTQVQPGSNEIVINVTLTYEVR
ncbi:hypothetical protein A2631_06035 [Candidatus Daviesbacteria bacterium RIFCSPHIGHO2_01_FULL_44_29]|uniref:SIMPL domain-containing protein n=1 Tax=Candidatus Daviesbacteria bacterium RIFCSPHIGHO2_02_FULL_43_12 TaxID=1797776 RepID=A0A1F5KJG9_9BACT|nr:MAG: hypothetical protein A2631_06035 [Candidatus Daviesbacteria bacterium RIFCSPHIGHO2_01_FULL_44_29]OGE39152.1 MAG: hypothetical protein A3E86_03365 [Candidatus Daviesbacteria bacterium RIFCSPHIGHO2_12_FULL_47_45]OGE40955.1 MAG: hypothetical protein A3D25_02865 [Candidatus Daviesbacteria bacterium RIFCSPHIGHO2_02_FULL_43_12]OGE69894.1 MAG: hypothetical protein A3B55_05805 [Candidatus Daviesbacteria bacterium RIFCSPLOWO2_01_FULL_43_15]